MKLLELKCKNCGANLKIDEESEFVNCPYCNASYKLDDETQHVKYDDMENSGYEFEKGRIKAQKEIETESYNNALKSRIPVIIFAIIAVLGMMIFSIVLMVNPKIGKTKINTSESDKRAFNGIYELYDGTVPKMFVYSILDEVCKNNKKNSEKIITVKYNETETSNPNEINELKEQFVDGKYYDVILDYGENGFVNKVTIK